MTQIIACADVSVFTSLLSGQVQGQKDLKSLCNELFPQNELERLGYSISYKSEGATDFAEVEDGGRIPRLSFAYGDQLKIQLHDLGLTLFNPEFNELMQIIKFDSLQSTMALTTAAPDWDWDIEVPSPSFDAIQSSEGYLVCSYPLEADSLGDFDLGNGIFLHLQNLFSIDLDANRAGGTAVVWWYESDYPGIVNLEVDAGSAYPFVLRYADDLGGTCGLVFNGQFSSFGPNFFYHGFWPEGIGLGLLQARTGWVYGGEVFDWRFDGEGVWQTKPKLEGEGIRVHGLWRDGEIFRGESVHYYDTLEVFRMNGEFYRYAQLDSLEIDLMDRHAISKWVFEPQHLKTGVLWDYIEGNREIKLISEGSEQN